MKNKSILSNTIIYTIKIMSSMLFPLITFPYISRVLTPEGVGRYNFSASVLSYFSLIAGLGIATYAIREGAKVRDDKKQFEKFAQEMFTINLVSMIISYIILGICIINIPQFQEYSQIIFILSLALPLSALGTEWVFSIFEDYLYITIRTIGLQVISLVLMFALVKDKQDVGTYALITVISSVGTNVLNYKYSSKYFKHKITISKNLICHLTPILLLFAASIASQIYINADITMLGFYKGDYEVGLYTAATKVYNIMRSMLTAFITVLTPRMAYYFSKRNENDYQYVYEKMLKDSLSSYAAVVIPIAIGIFLISDYAILLLSGTAYINSSDSLKILSLALIFSTLGSFIANEILIVSGNEKRILAATIMGAIVNVMGNIFLIPKIGSFGAAVTTLVSEILVFVFQLYWATRVVKIKGIVLDVAKTVAACLPMMIVTKLIKMIKMHNIWSLTLIIFTSMFSYSIVLALLKHDSIKILKSIMLKKKETN